MARSLPIVAHVNRFFGVPEFDPFFGTAFSVPSKGRAKESETDWASAGCRGGSRWPVIER
jgi:hypothetical protein